MSILSAHGVIISHARLLRLYYIVIIKYDKHSIFLHFSYVNIIPFSNADLNDTLFCYFLYCSILSICSVNCTYDEMKYNNYFQRHVLFSRPPRHES